MQQIHPFDLLLAVSTNAVHQGWKAQGLCVGDQPCCHFGSKSICQCCIARCTTVSMRGRPTRRISFVPFHCLMCQAEGRQLTCTTSGNECRDAPNVDCTECKIPRQSMSPMTQQIQSAVDVLQLKHFCLAVSISSNGKPSIPADGDIGHRHLIVSSHVMSTYYQTIFSQHRVAEL